MDTRRVYFLLLLFTVCGSIRRKFFAAADSFASIAQLEEVVNLEIQLGESLDKFVELEKKRLDKIKQFAKSVKEATELVKTDGIKSLGNPITTYAVIKRFANGWTELSEFLSKDYSKGKPIIFCGLRSNYNNRFIN